jgi:hypothetical protein
MRKLIAVSVLVGGLLAGAGLAQAQQAPCGGAALCPQAGIGDPLTLAASGVVLPYITGGPIGTVALIEIASPVGFNKSPNIHLIFFNNVCTRTGDSADLQLTVNDIAFFDVSASVPTLGNGLVAIGGSFDQITLVPLLNPIHSRVYEFNPTDGRSRVLEPIIIDTFELGNGSAGFPGHLWSPLRTAATFYAPQETATVKTQLTMICPKRSIQGDFAAPFGQVTYSTSGVPLTGHPTAPYTTTGFPANGFPAIDPALFASGSAGSRIQGVVYDTDEVFIADVNFACDCISPDFSVTSISQVGAYSGPAAFKGTYTEISVAPVAGNEGSFTGYKASFTVGSSLNNFFSRLSNGNLTDIFRQRAQVGDPPGVPPFPPVPGSNFR